MLTLTQLPHFTDLTAKNSQNCGVKRTFLKDGLAIVIATPPAHAPQAGDKAMVGNKGFRRFLKTADNSHFTIDPERVAAAARFDGLYVIRTNARISSNSKFRFRGYF